MIQLNYFITIISINYHFSTNLFTLINYLTAIIKNKNNIYIYIYFKLSNFLISKTLSYFNIILTIEEVYPFLLIILNFSRPSIQFHYLLHPRFKSFFYIKIL